MVCPYSFDEPGGVQIHALQLCSELQQRGHSVSLIGPGTANPSLPSFVVPGGKAVNVSYNGSVAPLGFGPMSALRVRRWLHRGAFDVVHVHEPNSPSYGMLTLAQATGPIVATYHASASRSRALRITLPVLRPLLERIHAGIAVSEEARRWQVEMLAGDPVLIPNGVDTSLYRQARPAQWLDARRPRIMFLGRFAEPRKGLRLIVDAMPTILAAHPDVELVIAGGGSIPDLCSTLTAAGMECVVGRDPSHAPVRILGRVSEPEKAAALAASSVYVAPNTGGESFGIVLVEAMATGTAVVASDLAAFTAVSRDGECARHFPCGNADGLATAVIELLSDEDARNQVARRGQDRSREFDWSAVATQVEAVYETVALPGRKVVTA